MIRTIIVDDEQPAIAKLRNLLLPYSEFQVIGTYSSSQEALDHLLEDRPQVAFLDIAMPQFGGLDLATAIQHKLNESVQIVFVTAYDEYAVTAFDLNATDYLLKPVNRTRFRQTIEKLSQKLMPQASAPASAVPAAPHMVHLFGKLEITLEDQSFSNWRTAKVRELLAFFIQNRGQSIYRETILGTLWGHLESEAALANMNTCNYYLRRQLDASGSGIALNYASNYYSINLNGVVCDVDIFENALSLLPVTEENLSQILYGASMYRGPYLEDVKSQWPQIERDRLMSNYAALRAALANYYLARGELAEAEANALHALTANSLQPAAWKALLRAKREKGDLAEFRQVYEELKHTFGASNNRFPKELEEELRDQDLEIIG